MTTRPVGESARAASLALPALLLGAVAISMAGVFVKLSEIGPVPTAFWRILLSLPVFWAWTAAHSGGGRPKQGQSSRPRDYLRLSVCGVVFATNLAVWHSALGHTTVANATLFGNTAPIYVTFAGWLLQRERVRAAFLAGLAVAMAGAVVLLGGSSSLSGDRFFGDLLAVAAGMLYACYILSLRWLRGRYSTASIMTWSGVTCCVALLPMAMISSDRLLPSSLEGWSVLVALALSTQVCGHTLITWALAHLPAAFSSVSLLINPVAAAILAWIILGEGMTAIQALAAFMVLCGIAIARLGAR